MPFGLINGPTTFTDLMNRVQTISRQVVIVYIKNVLKYSKARDEYTIYLRIVLQTLKEHQLHSKYKKREHWLDALVFLKHMVSKQEIKIVLHKAKSVTKCPKPTNALRLETFWVLAGHYQVYCLP